MLEFSDWMSGITGLIVFVLGLFPFFKIGPEFLHNSLPFTVAVYVIAAAGFYLMVDAIIEITNSNIIGWVTFGIAVAVIVIGIFPVLNSFGVGPEWFGFSWLTETIYNVIFMIEGIFLMVGTFARKL